MEKIWRSFYCETKDKRGTPYIYIRRRADSLKLGSLIHREAKDSILSVFIKVGHSVKVDEKICELREKLGLSMLPPTVLKYPEKIEELREIVERTAPKKIVIRDMETPRNEQ